MKTLDERHVCECGFTKVFARIDAALDSTLALLCQFEPCKKMAREEFVAKLGQGDE